MHKQLCHEYCKCKMKAVDIAMEPLGLGGIHLEGCLRAV